MEILVFLLQKRYIPRINVILSCMRISCTRLFLTVGLIGSLTLPFVAAADTDISNELSLKIMKGTTAEGTIEREHNFYAMFTKPGRNAKMVLYEKSTGTLEATFTYDDARFRSPGQLGFAVGTKDLLPLTQYRYVLTGYDLASETLLTKEGEFTTGDYPAIDHTWKFTDENKELLKRLTALESKIQVLKNADFLLEKITSVKTEITACIDGLNPVEALSQKAMGDCQAKGLAQQVADLEEEVVDIQELLASTQSEIVEIKSLSKAIEKSARALQFFSINSVSLKGKISDRLAIVTSVAENVKADNVDTAKGLFDDLEMLQGKELRSTLFILQKLYPTMKNVRNQKIKTLLFDAFSPIKEGIESGEYADAYDSLVLFSKEFQKNKKLYLSSKMNGSNQKRVIDLLKKLELALDEIEK